jgi:hypothetical protein
VRSPSSSAATATAATAGLVHRKHSHGIWSRVATSPGRDQSVFFQKPGPIGLRQGGFMLRRRAVRWLHLRCYLCRQRLALFVWARLGALLVSAVTSSVAMVNAVKPGGL